MKSLPGCDCSRSNARSGSISQSISDPGPPFKTSSTYRGQIILTAIRQIQALARVSCPGDGVFGDFKHVAAAMIELLVGVSIVTGPDLQLRAVLSRPVRHVQTLVAEHADLPVRERPRLAGEAVSPVAPLCRGIRYA